MNPHVKAICRLYEAARYRHDLYRLFSDSVETMAIALSNAVDLRQREAREARYLEIVGSYERGTVAVFPKILAELTLALETSPGDVLGQVFSALELHNKHRGQFFTPDAICRLMAQLQFGDKAALEQIIVRNGYITALEPCCGAGAMLIAMTQVMREHGFNPQQQLHVTAIDIDARAVHMAYVQLSLLHIPAVVLVGDALRLQEREQWFTPAHLLGGWASRMRACEASRVAVPQHDSGNTPSVARAQDHAAVLATTSQLTLF